MGDLLAVFLLSRSEQGGHGASSAAGGPGPQFRSCLWRLDSGAQPRLDGAFSGGWILPFSQHPREGTAPAGPSQALRPHRSSGGQRCRYGAQGRDCQLCGARCAHGWGAALCLRAWLAVVFVCSVGLGDDHPSPTPQPVVCLSSISRGQLGTWLREAAGRWQHCGLRLSCQADKDTKIVRRVAHCTPVRKRALTAPIQGPARVWGRCPSLLDDKGPSPSWRSPESVLAASQIHVMRGH